MIRFRALPLAFACIATAMLQSACEKRADGNMHFVGEPDPAKKWSPPSHITDFEKLYSLNCIACHARNGTASAAIAMDNQLYLNILPPDVLKKIVTHGVEGTRMPGFGSREHHGKDYTVVMGGGSLSEEGDPEKGEHPGGQIGIVVDGILSWKKPLDPSFGPLPPYSAPPGNAANGEALFKQSFAKDLPASQTYLNPAFLGLVSDQYLRTLVIVGQPELGFPNYRDFIPGRPLSDSEVSDVVAWLISNRKNEYGQPLVPVPAPNVVPQTP
jgi:cytochrome c oxidase cbb3-type subunit 3